MFEGECPPRFRAIQSQAERKLQMLDTVMDAVYLCSSLGNRLKQLSGSRNNQWSIRINQQWRIYFYFENGHATDVEIVDYH
ncbi:MAG: type II toxin-antitoxin system RelE/ParE family toxin [Mariprofundaceae bacterium]